MKIIFFTKEHLLKLIFPAIEDTLQIENDPLPPYRVEKKGVDKIVGILEMMKNDDYYPDFFSKAAYLFVSITKGHAFSNGNKRLALMSTYIFCLANGFVSNDFSQQKYFAYLNKLFPNAKIIDNLNLDNEFNLVLYNLCKIVADREANNNASFDELKNKVEKFLRFA